MVFIWGLGQHSNPSIKHQPSALQPGNRKFKAYFRAITQTFASQHLSCLVRSAVILLKKKKPSSREAPHLQAGWGKDHSEYLQASPDNSRNNKCKSWAYLYTNPITSLITAREKNPRRSQNCGKHQLCKVYLARHWSPLRRCSKYSRFENMTKINPFCSPLLQMMQKLRWQQDLQTSCLASLRKIKPLMMSMRERISQVQNRISKKEKDNAGCMHA